MTGDSSQLIGLDVGQKRTGLARADTMARLPQQLKTVETTEVIPTLKQIVSSSKVEAIVVGLPRNLSGQETPQTEWVRNWAAQAKKQFPKNEFYWQDEALTSHLSAGSSDVDAEAAAMILEDFINADASERVSI